MNLFIHISRREWYWVGVVAILSSTFINIPYIYALWVQDGFWQYLGAHSINGADLHSYLAWIIQSKNGTILFEQLFSSEPQTRAFFHPLFLVLGWVANIFNLSSLQSYHIGRIILGFAFIFTAYAFIAHFFKELNERVIALLMVIFCSGLGWFFGAASSDLWMSETVTFLTLHESVLNTASLTCQLIIFLLVNKFWNSDNYTPSIFAAGILLLVGLIHSYYVLPILIITTTYAIWLYRQGFRRVFAHQSILIIGALPAILWQLYVLNTNSVMGVWATIQTTVPSTHPLNYVIGYGLPLLLAVFGGSYVIYKQDKRYWFLLIWFLSLTVLLYFPPLLRFQRKFSEGLQVAITMLAAIALFWLVGHFKISAKFKYSLICLLIIYCSISNLWIMYRNIKFYSQKQPPYFISKSSQEAVNWMGQNVALNNLILTGTFMGRLVPGISGHKVYFGHTDQTVNYYQKLQITYNIISSQINHRDPLEYFVKTEGIGYIIVDAEVWKWGGDQLSNRRYLQVVYENADVQIYKVSQP